MARAVRRLDGPGGRGSPLWVAHWGVPAPTVPAQDWNGRGWMVWQYTSSGRVPGIDTNVDLDKLAGARLGPLIIRRLSLTVTGDAGTVSSSPATLDCRTTCARNVDPNETITLTATPDATAYFTGWGGDCAGTDPTCTLTMHGDRTVTARFVTDITPPVPTLTSPDGATSPAVVHFDEPARGVTSSNVVLRAQAGGGNLPVTRVCRSLHGIVPCTNVNIRSVTLTSAQPWTPGRGYAVVIDPSGVTATVRDKIGNATPTTPLNFEGLPGVEDRSGLLTYAWGTVHSPAAYGGSFAHAPAGRRLQVRVQGPRGHLVHRDGPRVRQGRGAHRRTRPRRGRPVGAASDREGGADVLGLRRGSHVITIRARGKRPAATDRVVAVDAFRAGGGLVATPRGSASWREVSASGASGGGFAADDLAGAAVTLAFEGTGLNWTAVTGPDRGRAAIYVDGTLITTVDLYALGAHLRRGGVDQRIERRPAHPAHRGDRDEAGRVNRHPGEHRPLRRVT